MQKTMELKGLSKKTCETYQREAKKIITYYNRLPEDVSIDEIKNYLYHFLKEKTNSLSSYYCAYSGI
jgi:hypothetical protein